MENLFNSKAKFDVVMAIMKSSEPLFLRELSALAGIQLRSVQLAVQDLLDEKLIISKRKRNRVYFEFNARHPDFDFLKRILFQIDMYKIQKKSKEYSRIAPGILQFNRDVHELVKNSKHEA